MSAILSRLDALLFPQPKPYDPLEWFHELELQNNFDLMDETAEYSQEQPK